MHVLEGGRHLLDLIDEVLDIARIEAGKLELSYEAGHVASALQEITSLIQPLADQRGITLEIGRAERSLDGATVWADRQRLKQVLLNLLSNAIKYNHRSGRVDLACERAEVDGRLRLSVRDTGAGDRGAGDLPKLFFALRAIARPQRRGGRHRHRPGHFQAVGGGHGRLDQRGKRTGAGERLFTRIASCGRRRPPRPKTVPA